MKIRSFLAATIAACAALSAKADATLPFTEQFSANDGAWSSSSGTPSFDNSGWTYSSTCKSKSAIKIGTGSATGSATTPVIQLGAGWSQASITVTFQAAAWYGCSSGLTLSKIENGTTTEIDSWSVPKIAGKKADSESIADLSDFSADSNGKDYSATFTVSGPFQLEFATTGSGDNRRTYLDTVVVVGEEISGGGDTPVGPVALNTPTDLTASPITASPITASGFTLSWKGDEHADSYEVEVLDGQGNAAGSVSGSVSPSGTVWTGLLSDTTYKVRVRALAAANSADYDDSDWSKSISVMTPLEEGLERATLLTEGFGGMSSYTSWGGQAFLNEEGDVGVSRTDRDTWHGNKLYNAPSSIRFGNASNHGWIQSPAIELENNLPSAPVRVTFSAMALHADAQSALTFSVLDADGNTLVIAGVSPATPTLPLVSSPASGSTVASELANVGASQQSFKFQAPNGFKLKFDTTAAANSNLAIDDIIVTQVVDPNCTALTVPANVAVSDIGKTSFTVSWGEVTDASGYEVWLNGAMADTCASTDTSISLTGLSDGTVYAVQVRALGDGLHKGDSALSTAVSATTLEDAQKIIFTVTGAPEGEVYAGDQIAFTVAAAEETSGNAASVAFSGISGATFNSATGAFSWTPTEADVGSCVATFTSGLYSTNVTFAVVSAWTTETTPAENFSKITSSSWSSTSGYATELAGDIGTWTGLDIIKTKAAIIIGRVASAGSARSPAIGLKPGATGVSVSFETGALPNMADGVSAAVKVSLIDAETGTALATETFSNLPKLAAEAQAVSDANAHYVLSLPAGTTVPESVAVLFESIHENSSHSGRVYVDTVVVSQTVSAKIKTLETPEALALADGTTAGESGFTVTWTPVDGATGYDVRVLDASGATVGSVSGDVSPEGTVWTGLADDTAYTVQVRATGDAGSYYPSAWSEAVSVTTARSALHPTLSFGAWQNEVGDGNLYASTANSAAVSATLEAGAPGTVTSIALSPLTPAQTEGAVGPSLSGGALSWTPDEADAKKTFTLAFAITVTPEDGEARTWTETVEATVTALPALEAPADLAVNAETLAWNRADFTWTKPFRAVSYILRVWSGAVDPDASGTTWSEDFNSYLGTTETQPSGWTFENGDAAYKTYDGVHVGFKASGSVTSPEISGMVNSLSFNIRSVSGTTSTLSVLGWNGTEWVELGSYTGEGLSTSTSTKTIENLAGAYSRFKWEFTKDGSNCAFGSVVLTGTGLPVAKVRTVEIDSGDTTAATVVPAAWGAVNYADITAHDVGGASQTSGAIQFSVPEQPPSVRATVFVVR